MDLTIEELKAKLLEEHLKDMFQKAYEQGLSDAKKKETYPHLLDKKDLAEIFQVKPPTVENIIRKEGFPKSKAVTARYPRDKVFAWIDEQSECVEYPYRVI